MEDSPEVEPEPDEFEDEEGEGLDEMRESAAEVGTVRRDNVPV